MGVCGSCCLSVFAFYEGCSEQALVVQQLSPAVSVPQQPRYCCCPQFVNVLGLGFAIMKFSCISKWFSIPFGSGNGYSQLGEVHFNPYKTRAVSVQVAVVLLLDPPGTNPWACKMLGVPLAVGQRGAQRYPLLLCVPAFSLLQKGAVLCLQPLPSDVYR